MYYFLELQRLHTTAQSTVAEIALLTQAEVNATMWENGLLPIIAPKPHFGNPVDAPCRPPIFSGIQYKLPTAAVSELKPFSSGGAHGPGAMDRLKAQQAATGQEFEVGTAMSE